jgi:hypothetical protein
MAEKSSAAVEMTILLPLDVAAGKLARIAQELRQLNMSMLNLEWEREDGRLRRLIDARLVHMNEVLDSIRASLSDIGADSGPTREVDHRDRKPAPERDD